MITRAEGHFGTEKQVIHTCLPKSRRGQPERNKKIVKHYRDGMVMREIAEKFGISLSRVSYIVKAAGARRTREELSAVWSYHSRKNMSDPVIRAKHSAAIKARWDAGQGFGRPKLFADDPAKREDYLSLRDVYGAAYAREAMGLAA
jgi:predicted DNA-binding protein YlxM (UPF0122 family)